MRDTKKDISSFDRQYFVGFWFILVLHRGFYQLITGCATIKTFSPTAIRLYDNPEKHHRRAV